MGHKNHPCGTPQVKPVGFEVALPFLTVWVLGLKYEANHGRGTPDRPTLSDRRVSNMLYRKLHSSLAAPSIMLGDYQRLLADRSESSAMPSLCLFYRLIVLSHTGCVTAYDGIVLQQRSFLSL